MDNPFRTPTAEEKKKKEDAERDAKLKLKQAAEDAKALLNSGASDKYRLSQMEARESLIKLMKLNDDPDPLRFAFFAKACLSKIDVLDIILEEVEKDAKKI